MGCNLKTMKLLDCALVWVCAIIRSNMVYTLCTSLYHYIINLVICM